MTDSLYAPPYQTLRTFLRTIRLAAKLTQAQLAAQIGTQQSYVSKVERGENFVDVLLYARWCKACGMPPGQLLEHLVD